eukprot:jgi/Botrbrau1/53/Bobra.0022s0047.1
MGRVTCILSGHGKTNGGVMQPMMKPVMGPGVREDLALGLSYNGRLTMLNTYKRRTLSSCRLSSTRLVVKASHQFPMAPALGDLYNKVKTHLAHTYLTILPGPYQYVASLTMPTAVLLSVFGGTFGHEAVLTLCGYLPMPQTVEMVPMARTIQQLYKDNPHVFHVLIDTTFSLAAVAYTFLAMPAIDLLLGDDPRNLTDVSPKCICSAVLPACNLTAVNHTLNVLAVNHTPNVSGVNSARNLSHTADPCSNLSLQSLTHR